MRLKNLTLSDRSVYARFMKKRSPELSAYAFANIYVWRGLYSIRWAVIDGALCIFFRDAVGMFMYLPPLAPCAARQTIETCFAIMDRVNANASVSRIENIEAQDADFFQSLGYVCRPGRQEYVYGREDLARLAGDRFKSKRWACNYFTGHYTWSAQEYRPGYRAACVALYRTWMKQRTGPCRDRVYTGMLADSLTSFEIAARNASRLDIRGLAVFVEGKLSGITLGCGLSPSMFCILYEVSDLAIKGLSQFIFRSFSAGIGPYAWINVMDDSGLENIRTVKRSYRPARLVTSFTATRTDG